MGTRSVGEIIRSLILIYEVLAPEEMAGHSVGRNRKAPASRPCNGRWMTWA
jgi:hypothetical protein